MTAYKPEKNQPRYLSQDRSWKWRRVVNGQVEKWQPSLLASLSLNQCPWIPFDLWPSQWRVFATEEAPQHLRARAPSQDIPVLPHDLLCHLPEALSYANRKWLRKDLQRDEKGLVDLVRHFGQAFDGRMAFLFAEIDLPEATELTVYAGADYRMEWWVDGEGVYNTLAKGNRSEVTGCAHAFPLKLIAGKHVLAVRVLSGSGGWGFASEALKRQSVGITKPEPFLLEAQRSFFLDDPDAFVSYSFDGGDDPEIRLNASSIPLPLAGMRYDTIHGIPSTFMKEGENQLARRWSADEVESVLEALPLNFFDSVPSGDLPRVRGGVIGWTAEEVQLLTPPVLGRFSENSLSLTCRTSASVALCCKLDGQEKNSPRGLIHQFEFENLTPGKAYVYVLKEAGGRNLFEGNAKTLSPGQDHTFVFCGDVYPFDDTWDRISDAVFRDAPEAVFFSGDMVLNGRNDWEWDAGFVYPASELLAKIPFYSVLGNHEYDCPLYGKLFLNPSPRNWHQRFGALEVVGIDGDVDWSPEGKNYSWLEDVLRTSEAPFLFVMTHYPPYSSGGHGRVKEDGQPKEQTIQQARDYLVPLFSKYGVQAVFSGHDHFYERSELPGGVTGIVSAGAGSRLYNKTQNPKQNPYSTVWQSDYHFCRIRVSESTCQLQAVLEDGTVIDEKTWDPR